MVYIDYRAKHQLFNHTQQNIQHTDIPVLGYITTITLLSLPFAYAYLITLQG